MGWRISPRIGEILKKGSDGLGIDRNEAQDLMAIKTGSRELYGLMQTADELSRRCFRGKGENHMHIGVNVEPCPYNCSFCSLSDKAGIFHEKIEFGEDQLLEWARDAESGGADALNIMTTGTYPFERLLEIGGLLKREVSLPLVANTRDLSHGEGERLLDAGFQGAYHALRLGEGRVTPFRREKRLHTLEVLKDVGLLWMNCVEPVGPEHSMDEILDLMFLARTGGATYSGVMRRINFPGAVMERHGMITEIEMAKLVAISRLIMGDIPRAHCTHEPNSASLLAGANLFFPEVGASPRDDNADTLKGRGRGVRECREMQIEMGWNPDLPSNCFRDSPERAVRGVLK